MIMAIGSESTTITIDSMIYKTPFPDSCRKFDIGVSLNFVNVKGEIMKKEQTNRQMKVFLARDRNILPPHILLLFVSKRMKDFCEHNSNLLRQENFD